ncbi:MAG: CBS domain-containing protein [Anaerolineales bacterium]|nr:CBS domain-containing protein [Anaerolineales bacterium]
MKIILTHEQADFDALASLLGAHLLDEQRVPVLPRRMNRNVRAFLTLYGVTLPFVDPQDLPKDKIEEITLVDTQSMVTMKGTVTDPRVMVIDHHEKGRHLPKKWQVNIAEIGATCTLLVEALQEEGIPLTTTQATLLLLGIYEDTGKLTYSRTTPRDVRAAGYLLEQGASLQILQDFINHPLSKVQQALYDQLRQSVETHSIHGNTVMIGKANAEHTDEELSTIAHKLRDLLDPDAIFLLVEISSGVQLIGRATSDQINVGKVAKHFGGGGHPRAAAALVRDAGIEAVYTRLIKILPEITQPAVTVAEIMSRQPQVLAPETPVREAAALMQRYGYEGYPVAENGRLVGLLTRRAVDRTLSHKLNLTVGTVMNAGSVTITPEAPLETLQQIMTDTGWGQVPVVEDGEIIGIVTRTDLLKTLAPKQTASGRKNLSSQLEASLPPARLALLKAVAKTAQKQQAALYVVGGFVRDLLLGLPSLDYDLVVEGDAIALGSALVREYGGRATTHRRFGTAKWQIGEIRSELAGRLGQVTGLALDEADFPETLDLVTARREFYTHPSALPTVERGSIKLDLHRRDFTINTLAMRLDGQYYGDLHDHWGGQADLQAGLVRVLHSLSFVDDPTRILRAVRFEQRFGYQIEPRTGELLNNALGLLGRVSGDRIRHEFNHMFTEPAWEAMFNRLAELGVLDEIHPALPWDEAARQRMARGREIDLPADWLPRPGRQEEHPLQPAAIYLSWLFVLEEEEAASAADRLRLPGWMTDCLRAANQLSQRCDGIAGMSPSQVVALLDQIPLLALLVCYHLAASKELKETIRLYFTHWQKVLPQTSGHDLRRRGLSPGPQYRLVLDTLRAAWLDGRISSPEEETALLDTLLSELEDDD